MPCRWLSGAPVLNDELAPVIEDVGLIKDPGVNLLAVYLHSAAAEGDAENWDTGGKRDSDISFSRGSHFADNSR